MSAVRAIQMGSFLLLVIMSTLGDCCFREIAAAVKPVKKTIEFKGCYPAEQMEPADDARKKAMVRLHSKDCNAECKESHGANGEMGLGRGHCWCGFKGIGDLAANHNCDVDCPGNPRETCGSANFVSVYTTI